MKAGYRDSFKTDHITNFRPDLHTHKVSSLSLQSSWTGRRLSETQVQCSGCLGTPPRPWSQCCWGVQSGCQHQPVLSLTSPNTPSATFFLFEPCSILLPTSFPALFFFLLFTHLTE